jgi:hypothetical protein
MEFALEDCFMEMVAATLAGRRVVVGPRCRERPLPEPAAWGTRKFGADAVGDFDVAGAVAEVLLVLAPYENEMFVEFSAELEGEDGDAVFGSLAPAHDDLARGEVDVFDSQRCALEEPETGSIQEERHDTRRATQVVDDTSHFVAGEDDGDALGSLRAGKVFEPGRLSFEHAAVEEDDRAEGLLVSRCADLAIANEAIEEGEQVSRTEVVGSTAVKVGESADPAEVRLAGAAAVVARRHDGVHPFEEAFSGWMCWSV